MSEDTYDITEADLLPNVDVVSLAGDQSPILPCRL